MKLDKIPLPFNKEKSYIEKKISEFYNFNLKSFYDTCYKIIVHLVPKVIYFVWLWLHFSFSKIGKAKYNFFSNGVNYAKRKVKQIKSYFFKSCFILMKDLNFKKKGKLYRLVKNTHWRYHKTSLHTRRLHDNVFRN